MDEIPQSPEVEAVLKIALADQARRAQADANWQAEYHFWHKIIAEEVERLRFNEGFEAVRIDLYPAKQGKNAFLGETQVGHVRFKVSAQWSRDQQGRKMLHVDVLKA
jgi:hypothetical protein